MLRRGFITGVVAAVAFPDEVSAQKSSVRRVGVLMTQGQSDPGAQERIRAFREQLDQLGWVEGRNLQIDYRWETAVPDRAQSLAQDLIARNPDLILSNGTPQTEALRALTQSIPVVFVVVTDPVGAGFVKSLSRPGGNVTGFSTFEPEIGGKWLELLSEFSPKLRSVAAILDPAFSGFAGLWHEIEERAAKSGIKATTIVFQKPADDLEGAVKSFAGELGGGLIVFPTAINSLARKRIFASVATEKLPTIYPFQHYATEGGLIAYGFDPVDLFRRSAVYVDRILKGAKPAELPVQAPVKFELVVNLKAAKQIGAVIPAAMLNRADRVIE